MMVQPSHQQLRQDKRRQRAALSEQQLEQAAQQLFENVSILEAFQSSQRVAAYRSVNGEIGLARLIEHAWAQGKQVYLPILDAVDLSFAPYTQYTPLRTNRFKLPEPDVPDDAILAAKSLDLVLVPLVVFDPDGNRIGMGGGYYDRTFEFRRTTDTTKPQLVGVAHELQKVGQIIPKPWDVRLDAVVTEHTVYSHLAH